MIVLCIRTEKPEAEAAIYKDSKLMAEHSWQAHRQLAESLHAQIKKLLEANNLELDDLEGVVVYKGPGSFTGLRIGISTANALAYGLNVPIVGKTGANWQEEGLGELKLGHKVQSVIPEYGSPAHVTTPKK